MLLIESALSGLFVGAGYALVAVMITLTYRSTGVLSFAHAAFAAVGAFAYIDVADRGVPKLLAAVAAVLITTAYGLLVERVVIRPVRASDAATKLIATVGVLTFTSSVLLWRYGFSPLTAEPLLPSGSVTIADVAVSYQKLALFATAGVAALALAWFLARTRLGVAVRAVAEDPEAARLHGVSLHAVARFNWGLGAALAGVVAVLMAPLQSVNVGTFTLLLARALAGTLLGGLSSLVLSFAGGLVIGVAESVTVVYSSVQGAPQAVVMLLVIAVLVLRRRWPAPPQATVAAPSGPRRPSRIAPLTARLRPLMWPIAVAGLTLAVVVPARSPYWAFVGGRSLFYVIEALSLLLLVGWGGQVNLMQGAYVGIGAFGTGWLVAEHDLPIAAALVLAALGGTALGALVGLPALRLSGLLFAAGSLAFSMAAAAWLFEWRELPRSIPRGDLFGIDLSSDIAVYFLMLAVTAILFAVAWNLGRSTQGRLLVAARDAPDAVAHFGTSPARARLGAFMLASFAATLGGGLYGVLVIGLSATDFSPFLSLTLLVYFVVGGRRSLLGPVLAGVFFGVVPQLLQSETGTEASAVPGMIAGATVIALLALRPDGLASLVVGRAAGPATTTPAPSDAGDAVRARLAGSDPAAARGTIHRRAAARHAMPEPIRR